MTVTSRALPAPQAGFSLIELMISMTVGLVLLSGVLSVGMITLRGNSDTLKMTRLNQELQGVVDFITRDVRRAGYSAAVGGANPFGVTLDPNDNGCLLYSYDDDNNGALDANDRYALRFNAAGGTVEFARGVTDCNQGNWTNLNDAGAVTITNLQFARSRRCVNVTDNPDTDCAVVAPDTNDLLVETYRIDVTISGRLTNDAAIARTVIGASHIRNPNLSVQP